MQFKWNCNQELKLKWDVERCKDAPKEYYEQPVHNGPKLVPRYSRPIYEFGNRGQREMEQEQLDMIFG